jgi:glutathione S-transferase
MTTTLYYHPYSRASNVIWMLEEVGCPYTIKFVDIRKGEQKAPEVVALNPMGKLPILVDGTAVVTESAAIGLYLADRYAAGVLAPPLDDPRRGAYLRWSLFAPSVIEPGAMAKAASWDFQSGSVGWGTYEAMMASINRALDGKQFVTGDQFSMADIIFGGTLRYMVSFKMLEPTPSIAEYIARLDGRPAYQRATAKNQASRAEHGLQ